MKGLTIVVLLLLIMSSYSALAHEGHQHEDNQALKNHINGTPNVQQKDTNVHPQAHEGHVHDHGTGVRETGLGKFIKWVGNFHPISIHFPIALIIMTGLAELLFRYYPSPMFSYSSRFMIIAAAITAPPTALLGLAYGYEAEYTGALIDIFWWHRFCGITTAGLAVIAAACNELYVRKNIGKPAYYHVLLGITILFVTVTGYLGGEMTFGLFHLFPTT